MHQSDRRSGTQSHYVDFLAVLFLFGVFVISGILLIQFGTRIYEHVLTSMNENDDRRTAVAYITQKVRQNEDAGAVSTGEFDGYNALLLSQEYNEKTYITYLYAKDGNLCELFCAEDANLSADTGTAILPVQSAAFSQTAQSIRVQLVTEDGASNSFLIHTLEGLDTPAAGAE